MEFGTFGQRQLLQKGYHTTIQRHSLILFNSLTHTPRIILKLGTTVFIHLVLIQHGSLMQLIFWLFKIVSKWRWPSLLE
jgi:hypothetical protein